MDKVKNLEIKRFLKIITAHFSHLTLSVQQTTNFYGVQALLVSAVLSYFPLVGSSEREGKAFLLLSLS